MNEYWKGQLNLDHTKAKPLFERYEYPWQVLESIGDFVRELSKNLSKDYEEIKPGVFVHRSTKVYDFVTLIGPAVIGKNCEIRPGAFLRGNILVGDNCVVGNSTELKNVILFDRVQVPHYNYVGDSVLGYKAHMGAGSITSNVKSDKSLVVLHPEQVKTGLKKMGAILGDGVEIGCNSVLNPGTRIGRNSMVYPLSSVRGRVGSDSIYKSETEIIKKQEA